MRNIRVLALAVLGVGMLCAPAFAEEGMVHLTYRNVGKQVEPGTFAAAPRELWRVGFRALRMEEPPDPQRRIHGLMIMNAPNVWMINRYIKQGRHMVDRGPTTDVHAQIISGSPNATIQELEFGHEVEFFEKHNARATGSKTIGDVLAKEHTLFVDGTALILYTRPDGHPYMFVVQGDAASFALRYDVYETGLPVDPALFQPPSGVKLTEVTP